jgi:transcription antitermination factor NusG
LSTHSAIPEFFAPPLPASYAVPPSWYALRVHAQREKFVSSQLRERFIEHYLPLYATIHRWSDRSKQVTLPLFPGYLFVRIPETAIDRVSVLSVPGAAYFVGTLTVSESEIEAVKRLTASDSPWQEHPFLQAGVRVRLHGGSLDGTEGIFLKRKGKGQLVISIEALERSLSISVDDSYRVEVLGN